MLHYRLYFLNGFSGHIDTVEDLVSADDLGAVGLASKRAGEVPIELWRDGRKLARFEAGPRLYPVDFAIGPVAPAEDEKQV
jgi:hypothetical protein